MATKSDRFPKRNFTAEELKSTGPQVHEIDEERIEEITDPKTGKAVEKSVLTFVDTERKLILNGTNWDLICEVTGCTDSQEWRGHKIELFQDRTQLGAQRVDCVRVRKPSDTRSAHVQPQPQRRNNEPPPAEPPDEEQIPPWA